MKILFCDNSLQEALNFRGKIMAYYISMGYEVILVAPKNRDNIPASLRIKYIPIELHRSSMNPFKDWKYYCSLQKIYKSEQPDYIWHYTIKPNIYGTLAARKCGIHSSAMIAGLGYIFTKKGGISYLVRKLYQYALSFSDYVLVLNAYNYHYLAKEIVHPQKLIHLKGGEGVELKHFQVHQHDKKTNKVIFLMIARVLYDKGYQEYVNAARIIHYHFPNTEFQLLGSVDTNYPNYVPKKQIMQDVAEGHIKYWGYQQDVVPYIQSADCIVHPSYYNEGLSRVLMEALAMGKIIITTNIPGCMETVVDGQNGFLIKPKDITSLTDAIEKFINLDNDKRVSMQKYSRKKAEQEFDIENVIKVYQQITETVFQKYKTNDN